jgi:phospholipid/cholesterol/gamma-HCH transport system permease protein
MKKGDPKNVSVPEAPSGWRVFLHETGGLTKFFLRFFREILFPPYEIRSTLKHSYLIGLHSLPLVGITAFIMGLVLTLQSRPVLADFGAESLLPAMVAVSIVREMGPVITAIICAGKVGSGIGAELASMKVTEQIDAMEVSGTNPFKYLVVSRVLASTITIPLLVIYADALALYGGYAGVNINGSMTLKLYFTEALNSLDFGDIVPSFIKTVFFGFAIGMVSCYKGYNTENGTEGVGAAANSAVVVSSLVVFILDMLAVQITSIVL